MSSRHPTNEAVLALLRYFNVRPPPRRSPIPRSYVRREAIELQDIHSGSHRLARGRAGDDWPFAEAERVAEAVERVAATRERVLDDRRVEAPDAVLEAYAKERGRPYKVPTKLIPGDTMILARAPEQFRDRKVKSRRFYRMQDGHQAGALFEVFDRSTGARLGRVRGTVVHVRREAEKLAKSQGVTMAEIQLEVVDE